MPAGFALAGMQRFGLAARYPQAFIERVFRAVDVHAAARIFCYVLIDRAYWTIFSCLLDYCSKPENTLR